MTTYCELLGSDEIYRIAYEACYSLRKGKAGDAEPECAAYASAVVDYACNRNVVSKEDLGKLCCDHVRDPAGTCEGFGWLGQIIAPDSECACDCERIAENTLAALNAEAKGANVSFGSESALSRAIDAIVKLKIMELVINTLKPSPVAQAIRMMYNFMKPMMEIMLIGLFMNIFGGVG